MLRFGFNAANAANAAWLFGVVLATAVLTGCGSTESGDGAAGAAGAAGGTGGTHQGEGGRGNISADQLMAWEHVDNTAEFGAVHFVDAEYGWAVGWRQKASHTEATIVSIVHNRDFLYVTEEATAVTEGGYMDVHFTDAEHGWVVGYEKEGLVSRGVILHKNFAGSWTKQAHPTVGTLSAVQFVDSNTGWAAGDNGAILATKDGGTTWSLQDSGTDTYLYDLHFIDAKTGWITGHDGLVLKTVNGGETWFSQTIEALADADSSQLVSMTFLDGNTGWVVGNRTDAGAVTAWVFKTVDGGTSWTAVEPVSQLQPPIADAARLLRDVKFIDANNGWVVGRNMVLRTVDGGQTWKAQCTGSPEGVIDPNACEFGRLYGVDFIDDQSGWAVGEAGVFKTTAADSYAL